MLELLDLEGLAAVVDKQLDLEKSKEIGCRETMGRIKTSTKLLLESGGIQ